MQKSSSQEMNETEYLTQQAVLVRGWSKSMINQFLGEPDKTKRNPKGMNAPKIKLFDLKRVLEAEESSAFEELMVAAIKRSKVAQRSAATRKQKTLDYVKSLTISLPSFSPSELELAAIRAYNSLWYDRNNDEKHAKTGDDPMFLMRIAVNYLRHECTEYDDELVRLFGHTGKQEARLELRKKIFSEIMNVYPHLADEAMRQQGELPRAVTDNGAS